MVLVTETIKLRSSGDLLKCVIISTDFIAFLCTRTPNVLPPFFIKRFITVAYNANQCDYDYFWLYVDINYSPCYLNIIIIHYYVDRQLIKSHQVMEYDVSCIYILCLIRPVPNDKPISSMVHGIRINPCVYLTNGLTTRLANYFITLP